MKWLRKEKRIERGKLSRGESYEVEVMVDIYWNTETKQEEEAYDGKAMEKIEAVHPGWFHTCFVSAGSIRHGWKEACQACQRQKEIDKTTDR